MFDDITTTLPGIVLLSSPEPTPFICWPCCCNRTPPGPGPCAGGLLLPLSCCSLQLVGPVETSSSGKLSSKPYISLRDSSGGRNAFKNAIGQFLRFYSASFTWITWALLLVGVPKLGSFRRWFIQMFCHSAVSAATTRIDSTQEEDFFAGLYDETTRKDTRATLDNNPSNVQVIVVITRISLFLIYTCVFFKYSFRKG